MSYSVYLAVIARALQDQIASEVTSEYAREILMVSAEALASMAVSLESSDAGPNDDESWIRELVNHTGLVQNQEPVNSEDISDLPPSPPPPENLAALGKTARLIGAAAEWVERLNWQEANEKTKNQVRRLVRWERDRISEALKKIAGCKQPKVAANDSVESTELERASLQKYIAGLPNATNARIDRFVPVSAGKGKQTAVFSQEGVPNLPRELVLRRDLVAGSGRSVVQEFEWQSLVHAAGLRVPKPFLLESSTGHLGTPFMIMERAHGSVAGGYWAYFSPPRSEKLALSLARQLGQLHSIPVDEITAASTVPAAGFAVPDLTKTIQSWTQLQHSPSITMTAAFKWVKKHASSISKCSAIVHGELQFHNVLSENEEITAVLDWEMAHIGHPAEDLGYCKPAVETMTSWDKFMDVYREAGGADVTTIDIDYFSVSYLVHLLPTAQYVRDQFEQRRLDDVLMSTVGASFLPNFHYRLSCALSNVL